MSLNSSIYWLEIWVSEVLEKDVISITSLTSTQKFVER